MDIKEYMSKLSVIYNEKIENEEEIKRLIKKRDYFEQKILETTKEFMNSSSEFKQYTESSEAGENI